MTECIRPDDLAVHREARLRAELAMKEVEVIQLKLFLRYSLRDVDSFDATTGAITRAVPVELPAVLVAPAPAAEG